MTALVGSLSQAHAGTVGHGVQKKPSARFALEILEPTSEELTEMVCNGAAAFFIFFARSLIAAFVEICDGPIPDRFLKRKDDP